MGSRIGMTEKHASANKPGADIMALVANQLKNNRGVFLGESHDEHMARDFLLLHLEELKETGVTTIYFEMPHPAVEAVIEHGIECLTARDINILLDKNDAQAEKIREILKNNNSLRLKQETNQSVINKEFISDLVTAAQKHGIRVLGHDAIGNGYDNLDELDTLRNIDARDAKSTLIINNTQDDGKFIVLGGSSHSRSANTYDLGEGESITLGNGLPERLNIPSIDFTRINDIEHHEGLLPKRAAINKTLTKAHYRIETPNDGTATNVVIHRDGANLDGRANIYSEYIDVPKALLNESLCKYDPQNESIILPPARIDEIIRGINALRR